MQNNKTDIRPNPPRFDEREAYPLGSLRHGVLDGQGLRYASYGLWVGDYRRYNRIHWQKDALAPEKLLVWAEELSSDAYEALVAIYADGRTLFHP